jgi:hypothetical protein
MKITTLVKKFIRRLGNLHDIYKHFYNIGTIKKKIRLY